MWWNLKNLWDQGLLYEDIKVVPYCPRCGTALSSHELGQPDVYRDVVDESAYVLFPLTDDGEAAARLRTALGRDTLAGLALGGVDDDTVDPAVQHRRRGRDPTSTTPWSVTTSWPPIWCPQVFGEDAVIDRRVPGRDLVGLRYLRPFDDLVPPPGPAGGDGWRVVAGSFVEADEGTGVVHLAPAFGEVDRQAGRENGLPTLNPVGPDGRFTDAVAWLSGRRVRDTNGVVERPTGGRGPVVPPSPLHPHLPPLLAVRHPAHLLGQAQLVRQDLGPQGRPDGPEPDHRVAPRAHP